MQREYTRHVMIQLSVVIVPWRDEYGHAAEEYEDWIWAPAHIVEIKRKCTK